MSDWTSLIQLLTRMPAVIAWMILISAAFLFHLRRPGPATIAQIGGSLLAFIAIGFSLFGQAMIQSEIRSGAGSATVQSWGTVLSTVYLVQQAGMLVYAIALIASIHGLPRPGRE
jgi:hypothetical protein